MTRCRSTITFARVDANRVIGVMDFRSIDRPFLFVLRHEPCEVLRQRVSRRGRLRVTS